MKDLKNKQSIDYIKVQLIKFIFFIFRSFTRIMKISKNIYSLIFRLVGY